MEHENKTGYLLLGILSMGPQSGDDINTIFKERISHVWSESYNQIFQIGPMLNRMVLGGLVEKTMERQKGKIYRKVYHLTKKGMQEFRELHSRPIEYQIVRKELLLKLIFGSKVELKYNTKHVECFQVMHNELLKEYESFEKEFVSRNDDPDVRFKIMAVHYCMNESRALLAWCDEALEMLRDMEREHNMNAREVEKIHNF
ncbi:MAG: PadR family transcriptional regulator [Desulfuromonadales bacterium]|nr:PadR family transcriptional regulator [Desulfuromonadales bacterium]